MQLQFTIKNLNTSKNRWVYLKKDISDYKKSSINNLNDQNVQDILRAKNLTYNTYNKNKTKILRRLLYTLKNIDCIVQLT